MRRSALLLALLLPAWAHAEQIDATLTTMVAGRSDPRDGNLYSSVPLYQSVALTLSDVRLRHVDDLRLVVAGWGEVTLAGDSHVAAGAGDLDLGYLEGKLLWRRVELRVGRQLIFGGAARALQLDGGAATLRLWRRVGLSLYGGAPVTPRFGTYRGDVATGARLFFRPSVLSEVGLSFAEMLDHGRQARQDLGVDARYQAHRTLALTGYALLSLLELRLAEADVAARWQPLALLQLGADYHRTAPDLFLPRGSILSVFSQETRDEVGGDVFVRAHRRVRVEGDYHLIVDAAGIGQRGGGRVSASLGPAYEATVAAEVRVLRLPQNGYVQTRLYFIERLTPSLTATIDFDTYVLEQPLNGQTLSLTAAATLGWEIAPRWRAVATAIADSTPLVQRRLECMFKLVYNPVLRLRQVRP
jgi:hypothetical protein